MLECRMIQRNPTTLSRVRRPCCTILQHARVRRKGYQSDTTTNEACFPVMDSANSVKYKRIIMLVIALTLIANAFKIGLATHSHNSASIAANPWPSSFSHGSVKKSPSLAQSVLEVLFRYCIIKLLRASSVADESSKTERLPETNDPLGAVSFKLLSLYEESLRPCVRRSRFNWPYKRIALVGENDSSSKATTSSWRLGRRMNAQLISSNSEKVNTTIGPLDAAVVNSLMSFGSKKRSKPGVLRISANRCFLSPANRWLRSTGSSIESCNRSAPVWLELLITETCCRDTASSSCSEL